MAIVDCEWGLRGAQHLATRCDALVVVDVLSFSTTVDIAVSRGATIYPVADVETGRAIAAAQGAELASRRGAGRYTLSPASLVDLPVGMRLVLPSPNGATISAALMGKPCFAGCLRNAAAVADTLNKLADRVGVVPAGERWPDGSLRLAFEDLIGAGAIITRLSGEKSPAALAAAAAFEAARCNLDRHLRDCPSGQELTGWGYATDVDIAAKLDVSPSVPQLIQGAYRNAHATLAARG